jgi:Family of unknown function (DUF6318)
VIDLPGRLGAFLLVGALGLLVGCGASDPSATANEQIQPASTPAHIAPSAAPTLPAIAKVNGLEGATATVQYWYDALSYAQQSGDLKPVTSVTTSDCQSCSQLFASIRSAYAGGGAVRGGWYTVREITSAEYSPAVPLLDVVFDREALSIVGTGDSTILAVPATPFQSAQVRLAFSGQWRVAEITGMAPLGSTG